MEPAHDHDHALFDRLCLLRALYAHRGDRDRVSVMSLVEVIRYGETLLAASAPSSATTTPTTN